MCESLKIMTQIFLLCRDLEVVSRQIFVSLLQVCSRMSRLEDLVLLFASVATAYFCCDSLLSFSMITLCNRVSFVATIFCAFLKQLCCNIDNHVVTRFQCSFYKLASRPKFSSRDNISVQVMLQHCLVLSVFLSRPKKSVATEACCH